MHYRWIDRIERTAVAARLRTDGQTVAAVKADALRLRAARYRDLAETFYDQSLVGEVEALARELDEEAARLEVGSYRFFPLALRKRA